MTDNEDNIYIYDNDTLTETSFVPLETEVYDRSAGKDSSNASYTSISALLFLYVFPIHMIVLLLDTLLPLLDLFQVSPVIEEVILV